MKHRVGSSGGSKGGKGSNSKGKGKGGSSGGASGGAIDLKDLDLHMVDHLPEDEETKVPRYHAVVRRAESDGVTLEDIDPLQLELEALLAEVVLKKQAIKEEVKVINNAEKYKGQGKAGGSKRGGPSSPGKRGATSLSRTDSGKRFKASLSGKPGIDSVKVLGLPKKSEQAVPHFDPLQNEQIRPVADTPKPSLPKNETPNRFWSFVEPYCAPISPDDIKLLDDLIRTHSDLSEYFRTPPLGQHYTQRWAKEDLENERQKSAGASADNSGSETKSGDESSRILKKAEAVEEKTPFGEMTQRLVAGLMEENIMTSVEDSIDAKNKGSNEDNAEAKSQLIKSLNVTNSEALEARVRKELEEQGVIDPNDDDNDEDNDEILEELKRCQNELRAVSTHNLHQLKRLLKAAKEELVRQELRNKLGEADAEVMDAYQKISNARSKKKPPSKKEREQAWKALKEREVILKELEKS